ncbi:MAG TPA: TetR/AcrR family transcriptional regulator C-terminal domain-containing protein [Trebonia sp.]|nr:TetR/AcrR family transcriptional regulator C-terminal domain-containing protein [Trebonia sp.]
MTSLWERLEQADTAARPGLAARPIAAAAVAIADADGLDAISMRRIAAELDADTAMSAYRSVAAFAHGATRAEMGYRQLIEERGQPGGADARPGLSGQLNWLLSTGRYPAFARYLQGAAHEDDLAWQFETGLDYLLDGIAARIE